MTSLFWLVIEFKLLFKSFFKPVQLLFPLLPLPIIITAQLALLTVCIMSYSCSSCQQSFPTRSAKTAHVDADCISYAHNCTLLGHGSLVIKRHPSSGVFVCYCDGGNCLKTFKCMKSFKNHLKMSAKLPWVAPGENFVVVYNFCLTEVIQLNFSTLRLVRLDILYAPLITAKLSHVRCYISSI